MNFWWFIFDALYAIVSDFITQMPQHSAFGVVPAMIGKIGISAAIMYSFVGSFVHLNFFWLVVRAFLGLEFVRTIYAIYKWIKDLNPFSG